VIRKEQQEESWGRNMEGGKFARANLGSVTDMCQNVSTTKHFIAISQTNKSTLVSTGEYFDLCKESSSILGWNMIFEPTRVVFPPPNKKIVNILTT
jgi:hypothetical protein